MIDLWFSCLGDFVSIDVQCLDFAEEFAMFRLERNYWNLTPVAFTIVGGVLSLIALESVLMYSAMCHAAM